MCGLTFVDVPLEVWTRLLSVVCWHIILNACRIYFLYISNLLRICTFGFLNNSIIGFCYFTSFGFLNFWILSQFPSQLYGQRSIFSISPPSRIDICVHNESKNYKYLLICLKNNDNEFFWIPKCRVYFLYISHLFGYLNF